MNNTTATIPYTHEWFSSEAGFSEYRKADTVGKKTVFWYQFLMEECSENGLENDKWLEALSKTAFILASICQTGNFPSSSYYDVVRKNNPYIQAINEKFSSGESALGTGLLECVVKNKDKRLDLRSRMETCTNAAEATEQYYIEQLIAWTFGEKEPIEPYQFSEIDIFNNE